MSFLNPFALLAMAAVAVPLFLHFFNLRRPQTVEFSSLAFVKEVQETAVQRVRIKEWLLLLLRMLAIACLVMAFAQPTLTGNLAGVGASVRTAHGVVMDNSLSMGVDAAEGGSVLEQAKEQADGVLDVADDGDEVGMWATAPPASRPSEPDLSPSTGVAREAIGGLESHPGASSLAQRVGEAAEAVAEASAPRKVVYAASDLQRSTLGDSVAAQVPEDVQVRLLPVEPRTPSNVGVQDVTVPGRVAEAGQPVTIEATLVNYGDEPLPDYGASVYLDDERVAQTTTTLDPGQAQTVSFTVTPQERGWLRGAVETEGDAFPADDRHYFTLNVPEERRVLVVRGEGQDTQYLDLALSSEMIDDRIAFETTDIEEGALPTAELGQYDTVLLVGPRSLSGGAVEALQQYVDRGGGVLLFPSAQASPDEYNTLLDALDAGTIEGRDGTLSGEQPVASFDQVDLEHPLFEGVFDRAEEDEEAEIEQPEIYHALRFRPSGQSGQTLIELSNGAPFLHEARHGSGALLVSAVAPTLEWSDLPTRGLFVPLLYRSVYYLSAGASTTGAQLVAGRPSEVRVSGVSPDASLRLEGPEGAEIAPEQRTLFGATLLQVGTDLRTPGIYDVTTAERLVERLAVNVDPDESDLRTAPPDSAAAHLESVLGAPVEVLQGTGEEAVAETVRTREAGTEIWNVFLLLALGFLVSEMLVARLWQPETTAA
ncbi:MAG: BatA domain-containing protein [Salinivenus sp.]